MTMKYRNARHGRLEEALQVWQLMLDGSLLRRWSDSLRDRTLDFCLTTYFVIQRLKNAYAYGCGCEASPVSLA